MLAIGLVLVVVAVVLVLAEAHLTTGGLIASGALVALVSGVTLVLIGSGAGLLAVLAVAGGVLVASLAGLLFVGRSLRSVRSRRPRSGTEAMIVQAAAKLLEAANLINRNPVTIQLRYLQTLREIGGNENSTIVFPFPLDLFQPLLKAVSGSGAAADATRAGADPLVPAIASNGPELQAHNQ